MYRVEAHINFILDFTSPPDELSNYLYDRSNYIGVCMLFVGRDRGLNCKHMCDLCWSTLYKYAAL